MTFLDRLFATLPNQFSQMNHLVTIAATIGDVISNKRKIEKQDHLRMTEAPDQAIILGLQILLDHK